MISLPSGRPTINDDDIAAVAAQLRSGHLEEGEAVRSFEQRAAARVDQQHGIATVNGFASIHLLLVALGIGAGDEVIVPSYSCPALLFAVRQAGADAIFADIGPFSFAIDKDTAAAVVTPRTRAIIVAYLFGFPAEILPLVETFPGIAIIEDIAQAFGVALEGAALGSRTTYAVASFYATKMVTSGDGGMVLTSDNGIAKSVRELVYYGGRRGKQANGFNYHMTNLNAALGLSQLGRLDAFLRRRRDLAALYDASIPDGELVSRPFLYRAEAAYLRYPILLPNRAMRDLVIKRMRDEGVECGVGVLEALHEKEGRQDVLPNTTRLTDRLLCLPIYPSLTDDDACAVAENLSNVLGTL